MRQLSPHVAASNPTNRPSYAISTEPEPSAHCSTSTTTTCALMRFFYFKNFSFQQETGSNPGNLYNLWEIQSSSTTLPLGHY
jgi:hypothetical protein